MSENKKWVSKKRKKPNPSIRMFCFPYAGGGGSTYKEWSSKLPSYIEVCTIQLPGRGERFNDPLIYDIETMVNEITESIDPLLSAPFLFYGHSMGSLLAFEVAQKLVNYNYSKNLIHLFVSGSTAPHIVSPKAPVHYLSDKLFIEELEKLNGTPKEVLKNRKLLELLLPMIKADFEVVEKYSYQESIPLPCPITAISGEDDIEAKREDVIAWKKHTSASFVTYFLEGDHFFVNKQGDQILNIVLERLGIS